MFFKTIKVFVLLSMGIILVTCSGLGITVKFDTEGPKLLPDADQTKMELEGSIQYALLFDEPIRVNPTVSASSSIEIKIEEAGISGGTSDPISATGSVDTSNPYQLNITPNTTPPVINPKPGASITLTVTIPANYLKDEADNFNTKPLIYNDTMSNTEPSYEDFKTMMATGQQIPNLNTSPTPTPYSDIALSVLELYAGDTVADVVYVTVGGTGAGTSWDEAAGVNDLWAKLNALNDPGPGNVSFLLVGVGDYPLTQSLQMKKRVAIIGGWSASSPSPWARNEGDITFFNGSNSSVFSVFDNKDGTNDPLIDKAMLHSVTVRNGNADNGAGMYNSNFSPTLDNVTFSGNTANANGGGMYNAKSSFPTLRNVTFSGNTANANGGGMYNAESSPTLINATFSGNTANLNGGGMYNKVSSPTLINATFSGNTANLNGGGMYNDNDQDAIPTVINSLFWGNTGGAGETKGHQIFMGNSLINGNGGNEVMNLYYCIVQHGATIVLPGKDGGGIDQSEAPSSSNGNLIATINGAKTTVSTDDPFLAPLDNYGGYVKTHALSEGSQAAINKGLYVMDDISNGQTWYYYSKDDSNWFSDLNLKNSVSLPADAQNTLATDARDVPRSNRPDIGAYESINNNSTGN